MKHFIIYLWLWSFTILLGSGCSKEASAPTQGGMVTQGPLPPATEKYEGVDLDQMTSELRRWIVGTRQRPASFEDYATKAKLAVPPAPTGKKFEISDDMRVVLVKR
ncbi:MAG: hypothetical protein H7X97_05845 [Opitutaceae bacterium]|nr:hypothetical protein [Verrucomicrobiales bacterium]